MNVTKYAINTLIDTTTSLVHEITPVAISSAIQAGFHDMRIAKTVSGFGFLSAGIWTIAKSGVQKEFNSKIGIFQTKEPVGDSKTNTFLTETSSKKALRWSAASVGLAATCYGIYNIASGIMEFMTPPDTSNFTLHHASSSSGEQEETAASDSIVSCQQSLAKAKQEFLQCPEAKAVWDDVNKDGPFEVICGKPELAPKGSAVRPAERIIAIHERLMQKVPNILFELINLRNAKDLSQYGNSPCVMPADDYAKTMELFEYKTAKISHDISQRCIQDGHWPERWLRYHKQFSETAPENERPTLESFLQHQQDTGHTDLYRIEWHERCGQTAESAAKITTWKKTTEQGTYAKIEL